MSEAALPTVTPVLSSNVTLASGISMVLPEPSGNDTATVATTSTDFGLRTITRLKPSTANKAIHATVAMDRLRIKADILSYLCKNGRQSIREDVCCLPSHLAC